MLLRLKKNTAVTKILVLYKLHREGLSPLRFPIHHKYGYLRCFYALNCRLTWNWPNSRNSFIETIKSWSWEEKTNHKIGYDEIKDLEVVDLSPEKFEDLDGNPIEGEPNYMKNGNTELKTLPQRNDDGPYSITLLYSDGNEITKYAENEKEDARKRIFQEFLAKELKLRRAFPRFTKESFLHFQNIYGKDSIIGNKFRMSKQAVYQWRRKFGIGTVQAKQEVRQDTDKAFLQKECSGDKKNYLPLIKYSEAEDAAAEKEEKEEEEKEKEKEEAERKRDPRHRHIFFTKNIKNIKGITNTSDIASVRDRNKHLFTPYAVQSRRTIKSLLKDNPAINLYALGYFDSFYSDFTTWYADLESFPIPAITMLYRGMTIPTFIAMADNNQTEMVALLNKLKPHLPTEFYAHLSPGLIEVFGESSIKQHFGRSYRMVLTNSIEYPITMPDCVRRLTPKDLPIITPLYEKNYPENRFDPKILETGKFFGWFEAEVLAGIAGVHVYSPQSRVAALGAIVTAAEYRKQSICKILTSILCQDLFQTVDTIGLNVNMKNETAFQAFRNFGFNIVADFDEYTIKI